MITPYKNLDLTRTRCTLTIHGDKPMTSYHPLVKPLMAGIIIALAVTAMITIYNPATKIPGRQIETDSTVTTQVQPSYKAGDKTIRLSVKNGIIRFMDTGSIKNLLEALSTMVSPQYRYPIMYPLYYATLDAAGPVKTEATVTVATPTMTVTGTQVGGSPQQSFYSGTNVQVKGIDEEDYVKTDGEHIALLARNGTLMLYKAYPPEDIHLKFKVNLTSYIQGFKGHNSSYWVAVVSNTTTGYNVVNVLWSIGLRGYRPVGLYLYKGKIIALIEASYGTRSPPFIEVARTTWFLIFDMNGRFIRSGWIDGSFFSSRLSTSDGRLIIVTQENSLSGVSGEPVVPETSEGEIEPGNIYLTGTPQVYIIVTSINTSDYSMESIATLGSYASAIYMPNSDTLYLFTQEPPVFIVKPLSTPLENPVATTTSNGVIQLDADKLKENTSVFEEKLRHMGVLLKASLKPSSMGFIAKTEINGSVTRQWQMDEYKGYLRLVTYDYTYGSVSLTVLNSTSLKEVSRLDNISVRERIHAVRFIGDKLYLVTYRVIDPLFYIDLSDPHEPKVIGYLKSPGFDDYLHPINNSILVGVGFDDRMWNARITTYRILENGSIKIINRTVIKDYRSPVIEDTVNGHKAFQYDPRHSYVLIPVYSTRFGEREAVGIAVIKMDNQGRIVSYKILQKDYTDKWINYYSLMSLRPLYIEDTIYLADPMMKPHIIAYNALTLEEVNKG